MRSYIHDDHKVQDLFASIVNRLSEGGAQTEMIQGLLKDVCDHFRFGCGLIYETDHTGTFILKESYTVYDASGLIKTSLNLEDHLSPPDIDSLNKGHILVVQPSIDDAYQNYGLTELFEANSLLLSPVLVGSDNTLAGLVVMFDRRHGILMNAASVKAAKTVMKLLGNHVKTRLIQQSLDYARQSMISIMDHMGIDIYVNDFDTHEILYLNKSMAAPYGSLKDMLGRKCWQVLYEDKDGECEFCPRPKLLDEDGRPSKVYCWDYQRPFDGSWFRVLSAAFQWVDGRMAQVISSIDITESKRNEELVHRLAFFDQLTGLPNRRKLVVDCQKIFVDLKNRGGHAWMLFFDLDNFKNVNDTMGHQAGDDLLELIGRTMEENADTRGHCYRLGGDEFVLFYQNVDRPYVNRILDFLLKRFEQPWDLSAGQPVCRTSIGVARYPDDGADPESLLYQADMAMYKAKLAGKGQAVFTTGEYYLSSVTADLTRKKKNRGKRKYPTNSGEASGPLTKIAAARGKVEGSPIRSAKTGRK